MKRYSNYANPADGYSNHWRNAPDYGCPECGNDEYFLTPKLKTEKCCKKCFKKY